ncbi:DUF3320 domain-containing protein [Pseudobacteroides cellulosolvens]|uniref:RAP domain-containing protein n=1 Tax=Pseudobacteroides cellulosolvens ATCC 35603 = DSM 2933 TaxID=398512 RepID=A0A0L6JP29_9FIRM|nr:DUF3320 domain-containing protein [Pseudobacteroides cellulosolvens]KNY27460.1 Protein of unknown function DUF4011 [Pseudobacteroides cellulosolvens ATCC 35603 = DSM 2933]
MAEAIRKKLEDSRIELLDLSLKNPFLNYRPLKSKGVEIINELSGEIYRILVKEEKSLLFDAAKEKLDILIDKNKVDENKESDKSEQKETIQAPQEEKVKDNRLQTPYTEKDLQTRLLNTFYAARTFIEEQGVNNLFLTLGMLRYIEDNSTGKELCAPCILVPVELVRTNGRELFRLRYTGEEIQENLSLIKKLSTEHKITISTFEDSEDQDIMEYMNQMGQAVQRYPDWKIEPDFMCVGFFSFGKYLMYKDLDLDIWPEELKPDANSILDALLGTGFRDNGSRISENERIDKFLTPEKINHVVDADSTQILALSDVQAGHNLVIQGPPGTGKSQTITNIIADAIDAGKKVLFVSEKMAALEVVKRRLDKIGLGDACLELHSQKSNKKALLAELKRVYELGEPKLKDISSEMNLLLESRDKLNDYCEALNTHVRESYMTPIQLFGVLMFLKRKYPDFAFPKISFKDIESWKKDDFIRKESIVKDYDAHLKAMGMPVKHPFWGSMRKAYLPTEEPRLNELINDAERSLDVLVAESERTAGALNLEVPHNIAAEIRLAAAIASLSKAPDLSGIDIKNELWLINKMEINKCITAGLFMQKLKGKYGSIIIPHAWGQDVIEVRQTLNVYRGKWWRFLSGKYRKAKSTFAGLCQNGLPQNYSDWISICDGITEYQTNLKIIDGEKDNLKAIFGSLFKGEESSWEDIKVKADWVMSIYQDTQDGKVPSDLIIKQNYWSAVKDLEMEKLDSLLKKYTDSMDALIRFLEFDQVKAFPLAGDWKSVEFSNQKGHIALWKENSSKLQDMVVFNHMNDALVKESLEGLVTYSLNVEPKGMNLDIILQHNWHECLLNIAFTERSAIAGFAKDKHESIVKRFQDYDRFLINHNQVRLAKKHWDNVPKGNNDSGQLGVLLWEFQKKSRHLPIRQLMLKAGNAIQAIKPVFMMSPISIANFLPPEGLGFDLVIFDEASQVRPVEAFGALMRAKQAVVVGDSKQMPPTSFFEQTVTPEGEEDDYSTADVESILALFEAQKAPQRMLRWHYRSRHESLIAVSNFEFYDSKLVVFPSPQNTSKRMGLVYNYVKDGAYDRSSTRVNLPEARLVAQRVIEHFKNSPELTLGVAAFSMSQMQAIIDEIELLRRKDTSLEAFFNMHPHEPFFVKNLENVQGDERDVIFISVGYGKTKEGYLAMSFGPLNNEGGERRLNVLISRARLRCEVFTNLAPEDIDLSRTNARGVKALKTFLTYARDGNLNIPVETGRECDSPFEEEVYVSLTNLGYSVRKQIGCAGFYIDLAVVDPEDNNRYILGIECDGASYHSARSARDRDRLRQSILEDKGWNILRIWSTDWFRSPKDELKRVVEAIEKAKATGLKNKIGAIDAVVIERTESIVDINKDDTANKYAVAELPFIDEEEIYRPARLVPYIEKIVEVESPVHILEVTKRIINNSKLIRTGSSIQKCINDACQVLIKDGRIVMKDEFLWLSSMELPIVRDRSDLPSNSRKLELISKEEIAEAIISSIKESFGLERSQVAAVSCQKLGFLRVNEDIKDFIDKMVDEMLNDGRLKQNGNYISI